MTEILKSGSVSSTGDSDEGLDDFIFPPANGGSSVEDEFIALEERELIRKAVSKILKGREKDIITLRYLGEGLTQLELGELFGVDKSHIAHTEKRALTKLREHLCT
jgi:RNA polymerase sigma factor (sigma-70 family)